MIDSKVILELLHINNDVNVQVKVFSTLSAHLIANEANFDEIISYNFLYDKICYILSNCPPKKATIMLNFLTALLYADDEENTRKKGLLIYAKNMIRSSGCLATICELFSSCMMHQDTWRSLCRCLAETCRCVEANQSYCTHLVPMCVQRCSQRNIEVFTVLQSLLQNHAKNTNLFIECNGISLFQREFLQHDVCLQLLGTIVQTSPEAALLINQTGVSFDLKDFLRLYGPQSQLGQWSTIILYYISGTKGARDDRSNSTKVDNKPINNTIKKSGEAENTDLQCSADTTRFFQNVMKEIVHSTPPNDLKYVQSLFPVQPLIRQTSNTYTQQFLINNKLHRSKVWTSKQNLTSTCNIRQVENNVLIHAGYRQKRKINDLSFSLLQKPQKPRNLTETTNYRMADKISESLHGTVQTNTLTSRRDSDTNVSLVRKSISRHDTLDLRDFQPKFMSTPKKNVGCQKNNPETQYLHNSTRKSMRSIRKHHLKRKVEKKIIRQRLEQSKTQKENKNKSISGWFLETINESCTTLVKTVKNIFRPKNSKNSEETKTQSFSTKSDIDLSSCSYSFTNYMRKRDAILKNECPKKSNEVCDNVSMELSNSCSTCNDTIALKHKLANDEYLKQVVRKLKLGINLYGCDFKKISKQLWPHQSYMTPVVLYNLYRKLIIK